MFNLEHLWSVQWLEEQLQSLLQLCRDQERKVPPYFFLLWGIPFTLLFPEKIPGGPELGALRSTFAVAGELSQRRGKLTRRGGWRNNFPCESSRPHPAPPLSDTQHSQGYQGPVHLLHPAVLGLDHVQPLRCLLHILVLIRCGLVSHWAPAWSLNWSHHQNNFRLKFQVISRLITPLSMSSVWTMLWTSPRPSCSVWRRSTPSGSVAVMSGVVPQIDPSVKLYNRVG